jgi:ribosomal protein S27AE
MDVGVAMMVESEREHPVVRWKPEMACPRCGGEDFIVHRAGSPVLTHESDECTECGLWHDGLRDRWLIDVDDWTDEATAAEYVPEA